MLKFESLFMQNISIKLFSFFILSFFILSCRNNSEEVVLTGKEYYPIRLGESKIYIADTFIYDDFTGKTYKRSLEFKEEITDKLIDNAGDTFYRVELSTYNFVKLKWEIFKVIQRKLVGNYAIETIDNTAELKLLLPISNYKTKGSSYAWNINMLNKNDAERIKYTTVFKNFTKGTLNYNDCVTIGLVNNETGLVNNYREEVYAKNIGLVYRHIDKSNYLSSTGKRAGFEIIIRLK